MRRLSKNSLELVLLALGDRGDAGAVGEVTVPGFCAHSGLWVIVIHFIVLNRVHEIESEGTIRALR